jgi:hypothetical protein
VLGITIIGLDHLDGENADFTGAKICPVIVAKHTYKIG